MLSIEYHPIPAGSRTRILLDFAVKRKAEEERLADLAVCLFQPALNLPEQMKERIIRSAGR